MFESEQCPGALPNAAPTCATVFGTTVHEPGELLFIGGLIAFVMGAVIYAVIHSFRH